MYNIACIIGGRIWQVCELSVPGVMGIQAVLNLAGLAITLTI